MVAEPVERPEVDRGGARGRDGGEVVFEAVRGLTTEEGAPYTALRLSDDEMALGAALYEGDPSDDTLRAAEEIMRRSWVDRD